MTDIEAEGLDDNFEAEAEETVEQPEVTEEETQEEEVQDSEEEQPEPDDLSTIVQEFQDPLDAVPEDLREHVEKLTQARFTRAQQRMADAVRAAQAKVEELERQKTEAPARHPAPEADTPQAPADEMPDPMEDPEGYFKSLVRQEVSPLQKELEALRTFKAQQDSMARYQRDEMELMAEVPELANPKAEEGAVFQAWLQHPDNANKVQAYDQGLISLKDLYGLATGPVTAQRAVKAERKKLARKASAATSGSRPAMMEVEANGWDDIEKIARAAAAEFPLEDE